MAVEANDQAVEEELYFGDGEYVDDEGDEEINFVSRGEDQDEATNHFDQVVSALQDVMLDPEFEAARESFCKTHCQHFEEGGEQKLEYMQLFQQWTELVESGIEQRLSAAVPGFDMQAFMAQLAAREEELAGDVVDLLLSLGDFETFRDTMLAYKKEQAQGPAFQVEVRPLRVHVEEQEDGDVRPDLDEGLLTISPVGRGGAGAGGAGQQQQHHRHHQHAMPTAQHA